MQAGDLVSGKYRLLRLLGSGGMGSVWAARNELTDRDFAIKFLHPKLADNKEALHRFFLEARACGQIKHPAVVDVYDMGQAEDGSPYLVMQLLEGEGFDQRLVRAGCFRPSEAASWIAFVARGLEEAHVRGLIHRDLKPGNIFFALDDRGDVIPKVLDFGVSKAVGQGDAELVLTNTGAVLGSPAYMSPEQARGDTDVDSRSDVWSLGVILYESLTGKLPFDAPNYNALMVAIITQPHQPVAEVAPGVPMELSAIVDQALAKERTDRVSTARELADRLEAIATRLTDSAPVLYGTRTPTMVGVSPHLPQSPTTQSAWSDARTTTSRRPSNAALAATMIALAVAIAGVVVFVRARPPLVNVAGRSKVALAASLTRLTAEIERETAEAKAKEHKAVDVISLSPAELPPANSAKPESKAEGSTSASASPPAPRSSSTAKAPRAPRTTSAIPVNGPGF